MTDTTFRFGQNSWQVDSDLPAKFVYVPFDLASVRQAGMCYSSLTQQARGTSGTQKTRSRHILARCPVCGDKTIYLAIGAGTTTETRYYDSNGKRTTFDSDDMV